MVAKSFHLKEARSYFQVEAFAAYHAIEFLVDLSFKSIQLEGDALNIVKSLSNNKEDLSVVGLIIDETKDLFKHFYDISFHVNRLSNEAANSLANYVLRENVDEV